MGLFLYKKRVKNRTSRKNIFSLVRMRKVRNNPLVPCFDFVFLICFVVLVSVGVRCTVSKHLTLPEAQGLISNPQAHKPAAPHWACQQLPSAVGSSQTSRHITSPAHRSPHRSTALPYPCVRETSSEYQPGNQTLRFSRPGE